MSERRGRPPKPPGSHRIQIRGSLSPEAAEALSSLVQRYRVQVRDDLRPEIDALIEPIKQARSNAARRARRTAS